MIPGPGDTYCEKPCFDGQTISNVDISHNTAMPSYVGIALVLGFGPAAIAIVCAFASTPPNILVVSRRVQPTPLYEVLLRLWPHMVEYLRSCLRVTTTFSQPLLAVSVKS
jgi:hypothetical protein